MVKQFTWKCKFGHFPKSEYLFWHSTGTKETQSTVTETTVTWCILCTNGSTYRRQPWWGFAYLYAPWYAFSSLPIPAKHFSRLYATWRIPSRINRLEDPCGDQWRHLEPTGEASEPMSNVDAPSQKPNGLDKTVGPVPKISGYVFNTNKFRCARAEHKHESNKWRHTHLWSEFIQNNIPKLVSHWWTKLNDTRHDRL